MLKTRLIIFSLIVNLIGLTPTRAADTSFYIVRVGDTLSKIAQQFLGSPVYTSTGSLRKIIDLNPQVKNPNRITVGEELNISGTAAEPAKLAEARPAVENKSTEEKPAETSAPVADRAPAAQADVAQPLVSPSPTAVADSKTYPFGEIELAPEFRFVKLEAKDISSGANAILVSDSHIGLRGAWVQRWSPDTASFQWLSYGRTSFAAPSTKTLETPSFTSIGFGFGMRFFQAGRHRLSTGIGAESTPYIRATSTTAVRFDSIVTPIARVQSEHDLFRLDPFRAGIGLLGEGRAPGSNDRIRAKMGYGLGSSLFVEQAFTSSKFRVTTFYLQSQQDSSIATQKRNELGLEMNLTFRLGGSAPAAP
jgi:LysM repeat protein